MVFFTRTAQFYRWAQVALVPTEVLENLPSMISLGTSFKLAPAGI